MSEYKQEVDTYKQRRHEEVSKRYDRARETSLKTTLIEKALKEKFESKTNNTNENKIINDLDQGKAVFLTGGAGVGKSYTTNNIVKHYENKGLTVAKLGSTGIAATNINGQTLHSFLELGIKKNIQELQEFDKHNIERIDKLNNKLQNTDMIIIDEISMVSDRQMEMIKYRLDNAHYQGKFMVVGDFNQLPPVSKDEKIGYAFESKAWKGLQTQTHELTVIKRSDNKEFAQTLNRLRYGHISKEDNQMLLNMQKNTIDENKATYIYSTNKAVHEHNKRELDKLDSKSENYKTTIQSEHDLTNEQKDKILEETPLYKNLEIKTGAPVLITANDKELGVANGDKGIYLGLNNQNQMRVKLDRNDKIVSLSPKEFKTQIEDDDKTISATATNYPIRPAYAITTHKSQGMSIDHLAIDPNKQFERNQFYVALSRALNPNNVKILPLDKKYKNDFQNIIKQDNKVLDFYHPTLRTKELKEFDSQVQDRQNERRENWFKSKQDIKDEAKHKATEQGKSNALHKPKLSSSFITQNKQLRQLKEFTKNKMQEVRDKFKQIKDSVEKLKNTQSISELSKHLNQQKEQNINTQKESQKVNTQQQSKQLQKEKG
jgi:ATP-dependent exoDNAse (exonuclease V) alpha subunit